MNQKIALITGATSGVGYGVASELVQLNYKVYGVGRKASEHKGLRRLGVHPIDADLTNSTSVATVYEQLPEIDLLIHSAGIGYFAPCDELTIEVTKEMFSVNVEAPIQLTNYYSRQMIQKGKGQFVFLGSQAGKVPTPKASVYAATKHALIGYVGAIRMELAPMGITVSMIHPGPIDTPFLDRADATGQYRQAVQPFLLTVEEVVYSTLQMIQKPRREVNIPFYMGGSSKLYQLAPKCVETIGKSFFIKK